MIKYYNFTTFSNRFEKLVNSVTDAKMAEQTKLQQQVTMKDPKKVEQGERLAEHNCRKREENVQQAKPNVPFWPPYDTHI